MFKRFFLFIIILNLSFLSCPVDKDNDNDEKLWLIGTAAESTMSSPIAFTTQGNEVFIWRGNLNAGQLFFNGDQKPNDNGVFFGPQTHRQSPVTGIEIQMYHTGNEWLIDTPGNYTITANLSSMRVRFQFNSNNGEPSSPHPKGRYGNYYEIFVGSFYDSTGNGMGDLKGIIEKLDYLNDGNPDSITSLNIDGIWLMPINPSPSYHKYDVRDYKAIDPAYGTMKDFEDLIAACNERGIRVIIDLVVNHTSTQHPWFVAARNNSAPNQNYYRAFYNISPVKQNDRWYYLPNSNPAMYYEAVFWDQMPDLNYDNPAVKAEMQSIIDFWLDKGVAGFRLDAVKHIYENNHSKNIEWLKWFTDYCKSKKADVYIVGEVWDSQSNIQNYYASGVSSNFNFTAAQNIIPGCLRTPPATANTFSNFVVNFNSAIKNISGSAIDAPFLTNHDIDRFASVIGTDSTRLKMAASMLLFMPGNPFIYYGEELGMTGILSGSANRDQNVRGPMRWSRTNRTGETNGPSGNNLPYWDASSVEEQLANADSILRFYIEAIKLKNRYPQIHWGSPSAISTTSSSTTIAAYRISPANAQEKDVAVVHNLSSSSQSVTVTGATSLGGTLTATSATATKPSLSGNTLTMPSFTTAIIEY